MSESKKGRENLTDLRVVRPAMALLQYHPRDFM
jgi:hypothetical protein